MGYYDFPHTRNYDTDLGYLIKKYLELEEQYGDIEEKCKAYTDEKIADALTTMRSELSTAISDLTTKYDEFKKDINTQISDIKKELDKEIADIEEKLANYELLLKQIQSSMTAYTDNSISVYDTYIKNYIASQVIDIKVTNYFTGEKVTVQEMFDYLSQFHLTGAISYSQLATRENTYVDFRDLNMTYTELAVNGYNLIPQK